MYLAKRLGRNRVVALNGRLAPPPAGVRVAPPPNGYVQAQA
jgi:hypothetical protein